MKRRSRTPEGDSPRDEAGPVGSVAAGGDLSIGQNMGQSDAWGQPGARRDSVEDPLSIAESVRYERGLELGRGGMGRVVAARDRRLGRQVALKEVRPGVNHQVAAAQLMAEAQLAAGLDHPGILAIHDAGRDARGQPWYAMRLVRGRTLAQAARALPTLTARLRLMQPLLAVCHAVAHAHERQIVHRDLKPDNLLVGPHGETQVADWGLACTLTQATAGGVVGTMGFMAPEVAEGQPASPRSDVYSLGATLVAVLHATDAGSDVTRLIPTLPPELGAIAERCLVHDPLRRYPDAAALAEDLSAWIEGRRVAAHNYSALQLLGRLLRAFRVPLIVAAVALFLVAGVAWQGYRRTVNQRDRALLAEQLARIAQSQAEKAQRIGQKNLAAAYVQAAESAEASGAHPEAETLAAAAVALDESVPAARGILARRSEGPELTMLSDFALPPCRRLRLAPDARWLLCIQDDEVLLFSGDDGTLRWRKPSKFVDGAVSSDAGRVFLTKRDYRGTILDLAAGSTVKSDFVIHGWHAPLAQRGTTWVASWNFGLIQFMDLATDAVAIVKAACSDKDKMLAAAFTAEPATVLSACRSGRLIRTGAGSKPIELGAAVPQSSRYEPNALAVTSAGPILLGALDGRLWADGRELPAWSGGVHRMQPSVQSLSVGPEGTVAALGEGLGPAVWSRWGGKPVRLPMRDRQAVAFVDARTVVVAGERLRRFRLREPTHPARFVASSGLSQIAVSRDGRFVAAGGGDGTVTVWHSGSGAVAMQRKLTSGVVMSVAFSPDGTRLAAGLSSEPGFALLHVDSWQSLPASHPRSIKRLGYFANGVMWRSLYEHGFDTVDPQGVTRSLNCHWSQCSQGKAAMNEAQTAMVHVWVTGEVNLLRQEDPLHFEFLLKAPWVSALALSSDRRTVALAEESRVRLLDVESRRFVRDIADPGQNILHVAFSPDDRLLFTGELDRTVRVWRVADGAEVAVLRGHSQRVAQVAFGPGSLGLLTVSWDGTVQRWDLDRLIAPQNSLPPLVAAQWGLPVEEALRASVR